MATFGTLAAALVQMKGFDYHPLPTSGAVTLLLMATAVALFARPGVDPKLVEDVTRVVPGLRH